jgi:hypothetical protein
VWSLLLLLRAAVAVLSRRTFTFADLNRQRKDMATMQQAEFV